MREFPPGDSQFVPKQFTERRVDREARARTRYRKKGRIPGCVKERNTRMNVARETRDSGERLEDNAIIRNYRVRPRLAELSHSVSITDPRHPWVLSPLHPPPLNCFLLLLSLLHMLSVSIRVYLYLYVCICVCAQMLPSRSIDERN